MLLRALLLAAAVSLVSVPALVLGSTSYPMQASSWPSGSVPVAGADVSIPAGLSILMDVSPPTLNSLTVGGTLTLNNTDLTLVTSFIRVNASAAFYAGSDSCRLTAKINITLTGPRATLASYPIGIDSDGQKLGSKGFACFIDSTLQLFGTSPQPTWTRLATTALSGASTLILQERVDWRVGDRLLITSTDYNVDTSYADQNELNYIAAVQNDVPSVGQSTITLTTPLSWMHYGAQYQYAEVAVLNRNFVLTGDYSSDASQFGGQLIMRNTKYSQIGGVEITKFGQRGLLGRYPVHWHLAENQAIGGSFIKESSVHHVYQRCIVPHDTDGVNITNNVAYSTIGHCYFIEDGSEELNKFHHNLGVLAQSADSTNSGYGLIIPSDTTAGVFWITNPNNSFTDNAAVSGFHGFWYAMPASVNGLSKTKYENNTRLKYLRYIPLLEFSGNVAHSMTDSGFMIDQMQDSTGAITQASYDPRVLPPPAGVAESTFTYALTPVPATLSNLIGYKNRNSGLWVRASYTTVTQAVFSDNQHAVMMVPGPAFAENMRIVGESDNIGNPSASSATWLANYNNRSRPSTWTNNLPVTGWRAYDFTGPQFARNITYAGFTSNSLRPAGAVSNLLNGPLMLGTMDMLVGQYFESDATARAHLDNWPNRYSDSLNSDGTKGLELRDLDGSITGIMDSWLVTANTSSFTLGNYPGFCTLKSDWGLYVCPPFVNNFLAIEIDNIDTDATDFGTTVTNDDYIRATWYRWGTTYGDASGMGITGAYPSSETRTFYNGNLLARHGYQITFPHATPPKLTIAMDGAALGDWVFISIAYPPPSSGTACDSFTLVTGWSDDAMTCVTSYADLAYGTYLYDSTTENLVFKLMLDMSSGDTHVYPQSFVYYESGAATVTIDASDYCTGTGCQPDQVVIPAAYGGKEDLYIADLDPCQLTGFDHTFTASGRAVLHYDPVTHYVSYYVSHNLDAAATNITIYAGNSSSSTVVFSLPVTVSPSRGAFLFSYAQLTKLYTGQMFVRITTASHPNGVLQGTLGCNSTTCSAPPALPSMTPCAPTQAYKVLYNGDPNLYEWDSWSWGNTSKTGNILDAYTGDVYCGTATLKFFLDNTGAFRWYDDKDDGEFVVNLATYTHLVFWAKLSSPNVSEFVDVEFYGNDAFETITISADYVSTFSLGSDWTRVKIPLATLGFSSSATTFNSIAFFMHDRWDLPSSSTHWMSIDGLMLVNLTGTEATTPFSGTLKTYTPSTCAYRSTYGTVTSSSSSSSSTGGYRASSTGAAYASSTGAAVASSTAAGKASSTGGVAAASSTGGSKASSTAAAAASSTGVRASSTGATASSTAASVSSTAAAASSTAAAAASSTGSKASSTAAAAPSSTAASIASSTASNKASSTGAAVLSSTGSKASSTAAQASSTGGAAASSTAAGHASSTASAAASSTGSKASSTAAAAFSSTGSKGSSTAAAASSTGSKASSTAAAAPSSAISSTGTKASSTGAAKSSTAGSGSQASSTGTKASSTGASSGSTGAAKSSTAGAASSTASSASTSGSRSSSSSTGAASSSTTDHPVQVSFRMTVASSAVASSWSSSFVSQVSTALAIDSSRFTAVSVAADGDTASTASFVIVAKESSSVETASLDSSRILSFATLLGDSLTASAIGELFETQFQNSSSPLMTSSSLAAADTTSFVVVDVVECTDGSYATTCSSGDSSSSSDPFYKKLYFIVPVAVGVAALIAISVAAALRCKRKRSNIVLMHDLAMASLDTNGFAQMNGAEVVRDSAASSAWRPVENSAWFPNPAKSDDLEV